MPNRMLRVGIITSEAVNSLSAPAEVFYRRLMSVVDDWGRYDGRVSILRPACYPLQLDRVREADVQRGLAECEKAGLVRLYTVEGKPYVQMLKWDRPRAKSSKWPDPPDDVKACAYTCSHVLPDTESDTDTKTDTPQPPKGGEDGFARFWQAYPRKVGKAAAEKAWKRIKASPELLESMLRALVMAKTTPGWTKDGGQFIPHPSTWLNGRRWEDEVRPGPGKAAAAIPDAKAQLERLGL